MRMKLQHLKLIKVRERERTLKQHEIRPLKRFSEISSLQSNPVPFENYIYPKCVSILIFLHFFFGSVVWWTFDLFNLFPSQLVKKRGYIFC